jgi:predicted metal-dependent phosphoesterase TrpH
MSDGQLAPAELLEHAVAADVKTLSITDHDTLDAYEGLNSNAFSELTLVPGVELSTHWGKIGIHVVGLNFRLHDDAICTAIKAQQQARDERAQRIAEKLIRLGFDDPMARVREIADGAQIGRPHFAQFLVETGKMKSTAQAFKKLLGAGKSCDIRIGTSTLADVIEWVRGAGGTTVLAHPAKYGLTHTKLRALVKAFQEVGGDALEVVSGRQPDTLTAELAALCTAERLLASCGSDFHAPGHPWSALGNFPALPEDCTPVWDRW